MNKMYYKTQWCKENDCWVVHNQVGDWILEYGNCENAHTVCAALNCLVDFNVEIKV